MPRKQRVALDNVPPRGTAQKIERWAADGASIKKIARSLGVAHETLNTWMDRYPALREALEAGRDEEHAKLHRKLMEQAEAGNMTAIIFALKARHGYREGDQTAVANKVSVTFNLPGALTPEQYLSKGRVIEHGADDRAE